MDTTLNAFNLDTEQWLQLLDMNIPYSFKSPPTKLKSL